VELADREGLLGDNIFGRRGAGFPPESPEEHAALHRMFRVGAFTFGGVRDVVAEKSWKMGLGADVTFYHKPSELEPIYGRRPASFRIFLRFRPGDVR
jgi:hypothetical protein